MSNFKDPDPPAAINENSLNYDKFSTMTYSGPPRQVTLKYNGQQATFDYIGTSQQLISSYNEAMNDPSISKYVRPSQSLESSHIGHPQQAPTSYIGPIEQTSNIYTKPSNIQHVPQSSSLDCVSSQHAKSSNSNSFLSAPNSYGTQKSNTYTGPIQDSLPTYNGQKERQEQSQYNGSIDQTNTQTITEPNTDSITQTHYKGALIDQYRQLPNIGSNRGLSILSLDNRNDPEYFRSQSLPDYNSSPINDPIISSTLNQIVETLSAYQSNLDRYDNTTSRKRRRNNVGTASPKFNPGQTSANKEVLETPQRIRAILAILEDATFDNSIESFVAKRDIEDAVELLETKFDIRTFKNMEKKLKKDKDMLTKDIVIERFF